jgi:hypothetical protein
MMAFPTLGAIALSALVMIQAAAGPVTSDRRLFFKPHTPDQTETLKRATSLAIGNLAWESVAVSAVQKSKTGIKWTATTRSNTYYCSADPDGQNSSCDRPAGQ